MDKKNKPSFKFLQNIQKCGR